MRILLSLSVIAIVAACHDGEATTAPATTPALPGAAVQSVAQDPTPEAKRPAPQPTGFTKVEKVVSDEIAVMAGGSAQTAVSCPIGSFLVGGGHAFTNAGNPNAPPTVTFAYPYTTMSWFVSVTNSQTGSANATFRAYALCAS